MRRPWAAPVAALAVAALAAAAAAHAPPPLELPASVAAELADEERRRESSSRHACFRAAYDDVASGGCRNLDDEGKMRLAFYFARCQLEATGRDASAAPCESTEAVAECGRRLNAEGYSEFGAWFRHVDTLCFALESRRWREDTSRIVASLVSAGDDTVRQGTRRCRAHTTGRGAVRACARARVAFPASRPVAPPGSRRSRSLAASSTRRRTSARRTSRRWRSRCARAPCPRHCCSRSAQCRCGGRGGGPP